VTADARPGAKAVGADAEYQLRELAVRRLVERYARPADA
jgi:hypothetical protein